MTFSFQTAILRCTLGALAITCAAGAAKAQDAALYDLYTALAVTTNPIPVKAALNLLGHDVGGLRLPLVEADAEQTATVAAALEAAGIRSAANV